MSEPADRISHASPLLPHLLPPVLPLSSTPPPVVLWYRFQEFAADPQRFHQIAGPNRSDVFERGMLVDDIAAAFSAGSVELGPAGRLVWNTPVGSVAYGAKDDAIVNALTAWVVDRVVADGRSLDANAEFHAVRPVIDDIVNHQQMRVANIGSTLTSNGTARNSELAVAMRAMSARVLVLDSLHHALTKAARDDVGMFAMILNGTIEPELSTRPHLATPELRKLDMTLCDAMVRSTQRLLSGLLRLDEIAAQRDENPRYPVEKMSLAEFTRDVKARIGANRVRFGRVPDACQARLIEAFCALPVGPEHEAVFAKLYAEQEGDALCDFEGRYDADPATYAGMSPDVAALHIRDDMYKAWPDEVATDVGMCLLNGIEFICEDGDYWYSEHHDLSEAHRGIYEQLAESDLAPVLDAAAVWTVGANEADRGKPAARHLFTLVPMSQQDILMRMTSPEGALIAQAILLADQVTNDRLIRGVDPEPDANHPFE